MVEFEGDECGRGMRGVEKREGEGSRRDIEYTTGTAVVLLPVDGGQE